MPLELLVHSGRILRITSQVASAAMELPTYLIHRGPVVISNRYDEALRMPHTRYFFMDDNGSL